MRISIGFRRGEPDTILGEKLTLTYTYSSYDASEIDEIEKKLREQFGDGMFLNTEGDSNGQIRSTEDTY